jgi:hypothetical protein
MSHLSDERLEETEARIGGLLTVGTRASSLLLAAGLALAFVPAAQHLSRQLLAIGLVVLMATPIARVAASIVGFARGRDWTFVLYTSIVLVLLLSSIAAAVSP